MKINAIIATLSALFFAITAQAAITITDISGTQFDEYLNENPVSWQARFQAGGDAGTQSWEIRLSANEIVESQDSWSYPDVITVTSDASGNIYASIVGGAESISVQPLLAYDAILVRVIEQASFGSVSFSDGAYSTVSESETFGPLFADESGDYLLIELGEIEPVFSLSGTVDMSHTGFDSGRVEFYGVNLNSVPEPSSAFIIFISVSILLTRRKRS